MTDPVHAALVASAFGRVSAPASALLAGAAGSFGPCAAPRYIALAAIVNGVSVAQRFARIAAFVTGLCCASTALAFGAHLLWKLVSVSAWIYAGLAIAFAASGVHALLVRRHACVRQAASASSFSGVFLLGSSFALVLSPCCAPMLAALGALSATAGSTSLTLLVVGAFVLGHALPVVMVGSLAGFADGIERRFPLDEPVRVTSGALMLAMSAYYAVLA
jgi:cytochrome c biogenesis protein CcdA